MKLKHSTEIRLCGTINYSSVVAKKYTRDTDIVQQSLIKLSSLLLFFFRSSNQRATRITSRTQKAKWKRARFATFSIQQWCFHQWEFTLIRNTFHWDTVQRHPLSFFSNTSDQGWLVKCISHFTSSFYRWNIHVKWMKKYRNWTLHFIIFN